MKKLCGIVLSLLMALSVITTAVKPADAVTTKTITYNIKGATKRKINLKRGAYRIKVSSNAKVSGGLYTKSNVYTYTKLDNGDISYASDNSSTRVTGSYYYVGAGETEEKKIALTSTADYYLGFDAGYAYDSDYKHKWGNTAAVKVTFIYYPVGGTLTLGKYFSGTSLENNSSVAYYKVVLKDNGYINLNIETTNENYGYGHYFKICDSKKKSISGDFSYISSTSNVQKNIGLKKGTYYIAVKSSDLTYKIKATFNKRVIGGGGTKAKAVKMKKGTTYKGTLFQTGKTSWYKFTLPKTAKMTVYLTPTAGSFFEGGDYGGAEMTVYKGSTKLQSIHSSGATKIYSITKSTKGTYYVKVTRYKKGSGAYTIKWS